MATVAAVQLMLSWWFLMHETWNPPSTNFLSLHTGAVGTAVSQVGGAVSKSTVNIQTSSWTVQNVHIYSRSWPFPIIGYCRCSVRSHSASITTFAFQEWVRVESVNSSQGDCLIGILFIHWYKPFIVSIQGLCRFFFCQAQCSHPTCATVSFSKFLRDERGCWLNQQHAHACLASCSDLRSTLNSLLSGWICPKWIFSHRSRSW